MHRTTRVLAALTLAGAGVYLSPFGSAVAEAVGLQPKPTAGPSLPTNRMPTVRMPPNAAGGLAPAPAIDPSFVVKGPTLSPAQRLSARAQLAKDTRFRALIGNIGYVVSDDVPITGLGSPVVIGDELVVELAQPLTTTTDLPAMSWAAGARDYTPMHLHATITRASSLKVSIDLRNGLAASIAPADDTQLSDAGGNALQPAGATEGD